MEISATKRIARNFSWLIVGNTISGTVNFLAMVWIARALQAASFGLLYFAQAFLAYLALLIDFGLSMFGTREIARDPSQAGTVSINILALRLILASIIYLISLILIFTLPIDNALRSVFIFVFLLVFYRALNTDWIFQGLEKMEYIAISKLLFSLISFSLIVALVRSPADIFRVPLFQFIAGIVVSVSLAWYLFKYLVPTGLASLAPGRWVDYFIKALPLGASIIMIQIYNNLDTIMLGFMDKAAVVGYYNVAYQVFFVFVGIFSLWQATAVPVVSRRMKDDKAGAEKFLNKYLRLTMLVVVPLIFMVVLAAPLIINIVFGDGYLPAVGGLQILIWTLLAMSIASTFGVLVLIPAGEFYALFWAVAAGAMLNIILNFILIPLYSFNGAAVATIMAEALAGIIAIYLSRKIVKIEVVRHLVKPLTFSLLGFIPAYLIGGLIGAGFFVAVYLILTAITEREFILDFIDEVVGGRSNG